MAKAAGSVRVFSVSASFVTLAFFAPSAKNAGALTVWLNGAQVVSQTNKRNFGYRPTSNPVVNDSLVARVGAYRGRQACVNGAPKAGGPLGDLIVLYDDIQVGTSVHDMRFNAGEPLPLPMAPLTAR